jgi:hypothetical protein
MQTSYFSAPRVICNQPERSTVGNSALRHKRAQACPEEPPAYDRDPVVAAFSGSG